MKKTSRKAKKKVSSTTEGDGEDTTTTIEQEPGLTFSNPNVIKLDEDQPPTLVNWTKNKNLTVTENGTELSTSGYYYYWATARASVTVFKGSWYYEVTIKNRNSCRIGWCTTKFYPENDSSPLGTDENSWAVDGAQQKKYHKSSDGTKFGDYWNRGDIIGCLLDFDQRRIVYYKNGVQLGVAFNNVRSDGSGIIPAISVSYDTKVSVSFGREFQHKPIGCFGMNPTVTPQQKKDLEVIFEKYRAKGQDLNTSGTDCIKGEGTLALAEDLGTTGPMDPLIVILAWKLQSQIQWTFDKDEWLTTWALQGAFTFDQMKEAIEEWRKENEDENVFNNFYGFVFDYLRQDKNQTALEKAEALMAWKMVGVDKRWALFDKWEQWWLENSLKGVPKDTWAMLIRFIDKMGTNVDNYEESDCWPTAIDDFVFEVLKKDK